LLLQLVGIQPDGTSPGSFDAERCQTLYQIGFGFLYVVDPGRARPCCKRSRNPASCARVPCARTSTAPSALLRTHPATPRMRASLSTNQRKPTPCTRPRTRKRRASTDFSALTMGLVLKFAAGKRPTRQAAPSLLVPMSSYAAKGTCLRGVHLDLFAFVDERRTCTMSPVSVLAGLVTLDAVALFKPGSVSTTVNTTVCGSSMPPLCRRRIPP